MGEAIPEGTKASPIKRPSITRRVQTHADSNDTLLHSYTDTALSYWCSEAQLGGI